MEQASSRIVELTAAYNRFAETHPRTRPVEAREDSLLVVVVWNPWLRIANFAMFVAAVVLVTLGVWPAILQILTFVVIELRRGQWFKLRLLEDGETAVSRHVQWRFGGYTRTQSPEK